MKKTILLNGLFGLLFFFMIQNVFPAAMTGTYTINPSGSGGYNFTTFTLAVSSLTTNGVSGPVIFNVSSGTYSEQILIGTISGVTATNTVTFQSLVGDSSKVILTYGSSTSTNNYTVKLNGAQYVIFKKMTISNTTAAYGRVIHISTGSTYCQFTNNQILGRAAYTKADSSAVIYSDSITNINHTTISYNLISKGSFGIDFRGYITSPYSQYNSITNNVINGFYYEGIYFSYQTQLTITGNNLQSAGTLVYCGMYFYYVGYSSTSSYTAATITSNYIGITASTNTNVYGTYVSNCWYYFSFIKNTINLPITYSSSSVYGIYTTGCYYYDNFSNNKVSLINGTSNGYGMYIGCYYSCTISGNNVTVTGSGSKYGIYTTNSYYGCKYTYDTVSVSSSNSQQYGMLVEWLAYTNGSDIPTLEYNVINVYGSSSSGSYGLLAEYVWGSSASAMAIIANNFITVQNATSSTYGLMVEYCEYTNVVYNSINVASGSSGYALYDYPQSSYPTVNFENNIVSNTGGGYAVYVGSTPDITSIFDYNDLYTTGSNFGYYNTNYSSLSSWQKLFNNNDVNSISINPSYTSATDLHTKNTSLQAGTPITGITTDINGVTRNTTTPYIGAVEYPAPMTFTSVTTLQLNTYPVLQNTNYNDIICVQIKMAGSNNPFTLAQLNMNTTGTTSLTDIKNARIFYTGNKATFDSTATQFGTMISSPGATLTFTGSKALNPGNNYFWLACGVTSTAVFGDFVDAQCTQVTIDSGATPLNKTPIITNPTGNRQISTPMSGTYTIDPAGSAVNNYKTFNLAVYDLVGRHVSGPVTFIVASTTFNERVVINTVVGTSATKPVKFIGAGVTSTTLTWAGTAQTQMATLVLNGASYITFKKMKIANTGTSYSNAVFLYNYSNYNTFDSCYLAATTNLSSNYCTVIQISQSEGTYNSPGYASYNSFTNSTIFGGYAGVWFWGYNGGTSPSVTVSTNNTIKNDIFSQQYYYGIYDYYMYYTTISNNTISNFYNSTTQSYGIYEYYGYFSLINANIIQPGMYGIYLSYDYGTSSNYVLISNNMISNFSYPNYNYGINLQWSNYVNIYHNSVWTQGNSSNTGDYTSMYFYYNQYCNVLNNIFYSTGNYYSMYWYTGYTPNTVDYNDFWTTSSNLIRWYNATGSQTYYSSLAAFQAAVTGYNANSWQKDPQYTSYTNLHLSTSSKPLGAPYLSSVPYDIDGQTRNTGNATVGADEIVPPFQKKTNIVSIDQPTLLNVGINTVAMTITNSGSVTIPTGTIPLIYTVDSAGTRVRTVHESVTITTPITTYGTKSYTFSGLWEVVSSGKYKLTVWIDTSAVSSRDTLGKYMYTAFSGTYYIDSSRTIPNSFANFTQAVTVLQSAGVTGGVTFIVTKGTYYEQIAISNITGSSAANTITFRSQSGNPKDVNLIYPYAASGNNYTLRLNGASYITFSNISIASVGWGAYHHVIELYQGSSHNSFLNDIITGVPVTSPPNTPNDFNVICTPSSGSTTYQATCPWTTISGCQIYNGTTAIWMYGNSSPYTLGLVVTNNTISGFYGGAFYGYYLESLTIKNNIIQNNTYSASIVQGIYLNFIDYSPSGTSNGYPINGQSQVNNNQITLNLTSSSGTSYGIYLYYCAYGLITKGNTIIMQGTSSNTNYGIEPYYFFSSGNGLTITKNRVYMLASGSSTNYGIYDYYTYSTSSTPILISDNFVTLANGTGTEYGIYLAQYINYVNFYHNSVNIAGGNSSSVALYMYNQSTTGYNDIRNNIFSVTGTGGGYAIYNNYTSIQQASGCDHNDLYVPGTSSYLGYWGGTNCSNLAAWRTASSFDANSISTNPGFVSNTQLYPSNSSLNFAIAPLSQVPDDIDGILWVNPITAGAAHPLYQPDAGIKAILQPTSPGCAGYASVAVTLRNYGASLIDSATINWSVDSVLQTPFKFKNTKHLAMLHDTTLFIGNYNFTTGVHTLAVSSSKPNGIADANPANDGDTLYGIKIYAVPGTPKVYSNSMSPICGGGSTTLMASGAIRYTWWDSPTGGNVLKVGTDSFLVTPPLTANTTYYVSAGSVGAPNKLATSTTGTAYSDNGFMFDVAAKAYDVKIDSFDIVPTTSGQYYTIELYYKPGSYSGYAGTSSAWTYGGSINFYTTSTNPVHIPFGLLVPKGQTYGIYLTSNSSFLNIQSMKGSNSVSDSNLSISGGTSVIDSFITLAPVAALWEGAVYYEGKSLCNSSRVAVTAYVNTKPKSSFTVNATNQCLSTNKFLFTNTTTSTDTLSSCAWNFGDGTTTTLTGPTYSLTSVSHTYLSPGTYKVKLTATNIRGCLDTTSLKVTVNQGPTANAGGTTKYMLCGDTAFIGSGNISSYQYQWYPSTYLSDTTKSSPFAIPIGNITYYLTVTDLNTGCKAKDSISLKITNSPKANAGKDQFICIGKTATLTVTGGATCIWNTGDTTHTITKSPTVNTPYIVTVYNKGCSGKDTVMVYVYGYPKSGFTVINNTQCLGGNLFKFTNSTSIKNGTTYLWNFGDGKTSTDSIPTHSYTIDNTYTVKLNATNSIGCKDSTTQKAYVNPTPVANFAINDTAQCNHGNLFAMTNNSSISSGSFTSQWSFGDGGSSNNTSPIYTYTAGVKAYTIKLVTTSALGCKDSLSRIININPSPTASFDIDQSSACFDDSFLFSFTNTSTITSGSLNYLWRMGDNTGGNYAGQFQHHYQYPGTYKVTLISTSNLGCIDSLTKIVNFFSQPSVDLSPHTRAVLPGAKVTLDAGGPFAHYKWTNDDTKKVIGSQETIIIDSSFIAGALPKTSLFSVIITDKNGCLAFDAVTITFTTVKGINTQGKDNPAITIYPNPSNGIIYLNFKQLDNEDVNISVFNAQGQIIYHQKTRVDSDASIKELDFSSQGKGFYFIRFDYKGMSYNGKFIIN